MSTFIQEQAEAEQRAEDVINDTNDIHPLSRNDELSNEHDFSLQEIRGALQDIEDLDGFLIPYKLLDEHRELNSLLNLSQLLAELSDPSFSLQPGKDIEPREDVEKATLLKNLIGQEVAVSSAHPEFTAEGVTFDGICRIDSAENIEIISQEPLQLRGELYVIEGSLTNEDSNLPGDTSIKGITLSFTSASTYLRPLTNADTLELSQAA